MTFTNEHSVETARKVLDQEVDPFIVEVMSRMNMHAAMMEQDGQQRNPMSPAERFRKDYDAAAELVELIKNAS
jgi:hypothetical protein